MDKYKQLVQQVYIEPKNEEILRSFLQANETIDSVEAQPVSKKAKWRENKPIRQLTDKKDIHFFKKQGIKTNTETRSKRPSIITTDE